MPALFSRRRMIAVGGAAAVAAPIAGRPALAATPTPIAGQLVTLLSPIRVFDSRQTTSVLGGRAFRPGDSVAVNVGAAYPEFALAVFVNVTITQTVGGGFLTVWGGDASGELDTPGTSNVNWTTGGQTLANLALTTVGQENSIEVVCGGTGSTHVIVDVQGYVPFVT